MLIPPAIAIIGTSWSLALVQSIIANHHLQIDWISSHPSCYFAGGPLTAEALSCLAESSYDLPLIPSVSFWRRLQGVASFAISSSHLKPSLESLKELWPRLHDTPRVMCYELTPKALLLGQKMRSLWSEVSINWSPEGMTLDEKFYHAVIVIGPHKDIWEKIIQGAPKDIKNMGPETKTVYCCKNGCKIAFSNNPIINQENIQWALWAKAGWYENWTLQSPVVLWAFETPFYIENFLNQKKLFENFMKKTSFHARQQALRVR